MTQASTQPASASVSGADKPLVYVNGKMLPKHQASVSVFDHGLLYGDGIFEGIRVYRGRIFKAGQHLDRLYRCAEQLFLTVPVGKSEMLEIMRRCVSANGIVDGYIRLLVTRGEGTLGLNPYHCPEAGIVCIADQITLYKPEMYERGMRVVLAHRPKTPIACLDPRIKSLNYLNNILAKVEAIHLNRSLNITNPEDQLLEVIMLNTEGRVTEGSGDNIFLVKGGRLVTPPAGVGILEGITRRFVKNELCPALGYECVEREFGIDELYGADEVFLTGSAAEMIAVREVLEHDGEGGVTATHTISDGEGPVTNALRTKFRGVVTGDDVPED
jgi:branched-chain amino acid aminotransferase